MMPTLYISLPYGCQQKVHRCTRGTPNSVLRCDQKSPAPQGSVLGDLGWPGATHVPELPQQLQGAVPRPPAPVWLAAPPLGTGPGRLWGTSQEEACRQRGTHNSWIFAARWTSIMHCIKIQMLEHEAGNSKKQHEQSKCQRNEKYDQNCDRAFGYLSHNIINRLSSKISNTWEEITKIFKDTIFVFWMLIWHKGVCMRECL